MGTTEPVRRMSLEDFRVFMLGPNAAELSGRIHSVITEPVEDGGGGSRAGS